MVEAAHHPHGLPRARGSVMGCAPTLGTGGGVGGGELLGQRGAFGVALEVFRVCGSSGAGGTGIVLRNLYRALQGPRSNECSIGGTRVELRASGKQVNGSGDREQASAQV